MFEYRQVLTRMRLGDTDRAIARVGLMGRRKVAQLRRTAEAAGGLDVATPLPDDPELAVHLGSVRTQPAVGSVFDSGTATHHLTLYRHASGALVFGAGTVQWAWGLDAHHDTETGVPPERVNENTTRIGVDPNGPDRNVRQATVNLFADMGVQPATLAPDLVRAEASEDREPPVSRIVEPRTGSSLPPGPVQIAGTAHDRGGGCIAAVEVSVDGGATWHPAEGRAVWRYEWKPEGSGTRTIVCRAVDDSGNLEAPAAGVTVTVSHDLPPLQNPGADGRTLRT